VGPRPPTTEKFGREKREEPLLHHRVRGKEVVVELLLFDENAGEEVVWWPLYEESSGWGSRTPWREWRPAAQQEGCQHCRWQRTVI
jgi:hypothetical protein